MFISKGSFDWLLVSTLRERTFDIHVEKRPYWLQFYSNLNKVYSAWKASKQRKIRTRKKSGHFSHSLWNEVYHHEVTQQAFVLMKTSWRRLKDVFCLRLQDVLIQTNTFALALRLQKTSSRRLQDVLVKTNIFVLAIRLQDVLTRCLQYIFKTSCEDVFKMSSKRLQDIFKTSSKCL